MQHPPLALMKRWSDADLPVRKMVWTDIGHFPVEVTT